MLRVSGPDNLPQINVVASIGFEIWGIVDPGKKMSIFTGKFLKNSIFFQAISKTNFDLIGHLQQLLGKLFYFSSKVTTFEHTSCT